MGFGITAACLASLRGRNARAVAFMLTRPLYRLSHCLVSLWQHPGRPLIPGLAGNLSTGQNASTL